MGKRSASKETADEPSEAALASEVAAFASQLGLASAGVVSQGFDDSDFRPDKAALKLGEVAPEPGKSKRKSTNKFRKPEAEPENDDSLPPAPYVKEIDPELEAAIRERRWNEGVGERPGEHTLTAGATCAPPCGAEQRGHWHCCQAAHCTAFRLAAPPAVYRSQQSVPHRSCMASSH